MKHHDFDHDANRRASEARKYAPENCPPDAIPMWIADTDFLCPQELIDAMTARVALGHFGYPNTDFSFSEAVALWQEKRFGWKAEANWCEFVPGAIMTLLYGMRAFSGTGDAVLIQTPAYPPFYALIKNNGRQLVENPLVLKDGRYEIDFEDLERGLSKPRTRVMFLCNPHNPTGRNFTRDELVKIDDLCKKYNVFVVSDEIHGDITYYGASHIPYCTISDHAAANSAISVNPSKTFNTAGLRTAAMICPNPNVKALMLEQRMNNKAFGRPIFGALAVEVLYNQCDYYVDEMLPYLEENIRILREGLAKTNGKIKLIEPEGTYLLWLDCRNLGLSQPELVRFMKEEAKLILNDGQTFGKEGIGFMRMNIACPHATMRKAVQQLLQAVSRR